MSMDQFTTMYLDWVNNFLTVGRFAEHYEISIDDAQRIIELGREIMGMTLPRVIY